MSTIERKANSYKSSDDWLLMNCKTNIVIYNIIHNVSEDIYAKLVLLHVGGN